MKSSYALALVLLALPQVARAAPPTGGSPVILTPPASASGSQALPPPGRSGGPWVVVEQPPAPVYTPTQNVVVTGNFDRMARGLRIERVGVLTATVGLVVELVGVGIASGSSGSLWTGDGGSVLWAGYGLTTAGLLVGGASGLVVSNELRRFGITPHRRGMAITSILLSFGPFVHVLAYVLELVHLRRSQAVATSMQRVGFRGAPFFSATPGNTTIGSRFVLTF